MESIHTMASKKSTANGSDRASAWIGNTPSSTPASRIRWAFSETLNHRSVAQTCTPNSRRRKIDEDARPQPRSSTRMPGRKSNAAVSHSVSQSELAPPLTLDVTHSGWYCEERGKRSETSSLSEVTLLPILSQCTIREERLLKDAQDGDRKPAHRGWQQRQRVSTDSVCCFSFLGSGSEGCCRCCRELAASPGVPSVCWRGRSGNHPTKRHREHPTTCARSNYQGKTPNPINRLPLPPEKGDDRVLCENPLPPLPETGAPRQPLAYPVHWNWSRS